MNTIGKILLGVAFVVIVIGIVNLFLDKKQENTPVVIYVEQRSEEGVEEEIIEHREEMPEQREITLPQKISNDVPFTPQAPSAQWDNPLYQDACEEASLLMVARWVQGSEGNIKKDDAQEALEALFAFEREHYGNALDTSAIDTAQTMREYFDHKNVSVEDVGSPEHIVSRLARGSIVIVPVDGRALENKFFSGEGPQRHMLVITGYDLRKKEFITNDPGTRRGEDFRYSFDNLFGALRDYPSGHKEPIVAQHKRMIIVHKN